MTTYSRLINIIHWLAIIIWTSAIVSAAVSAMNVFPAMDDMPLALDQYPAYPVTEHPHLAAGRIMEGIFFTTDLLQFAAVPLVVLTLAAQIFFFHSSLKRITNIIRTACIVIAAGLFAYHAFALAPNMNRELRSYWSAAEAGDLVAAQSHRDAFNTYHHKADPILRINLLLLTATIASTSIALGPTKNDGEHFRGPHLEPPKLLKNS